MAACRRYLVLFLCCILTVLQSYAQAPLNDNCANAAVISTGTTYATGNYNSVKIKLRRATTQPGESFPKLLSDLGLNKRTVWYKFSVNMRKSVSIELKQKDSLIDQNAVGFAVYKYSNSCPPNLGQLDPSLAVLTKFGSTTNTCLAQGTYLIQVCANNHANDSIWINLDVRSSSPAFFDQGLSAWSPGVLTGFASVQGDATCLTNDSANELCPALGTGYKDYNKTAWVVFKTDGRPDFISLIVNSFARRSRTDSNAFAYILYEGNAANGSQTLKMIDKPKVFSSKCTQYCVTSGVSAYLCRLKPNTLYSIQIFFHKDAESQFQVYLEKNGKDTAKAANPKNLPAAYHLGTLQQGKTYELKDVLACNAHTELYACGTSLPVATIDTLYYDDNGKPYTDTFDLNTWCTFQVTDSCQFQVTNHAYDCQNYDVVPNSSSIRMMLYRGDITRTCDLSLFYKGNANALRYSTLCLPPGIYSYKLLGASYHANVLSCSEVTLGMPIDYKITITPKYKQYPARYNTPAHAENMGDITKMLDKGGAITDTVDYALAPFDTVTIDGVFLSDRQVYRQFYISHDAFIKIQYPQCDYYPCGHDYYMHLFQGKVSDGINKLKKLAFKYFGYPYDNNAYYYYDNRDTTFFRSGCIPLPAGWYTVVGSCLLQCNVNGTVYNQVRISQHVYCKPKYSRPYKACKVNSLQPLTYNSVLTSGRTAQTYTFPPECFACESDIPFAVPACKPTYPPIPYDKVAYYVFKLSRPVYAKFKCINELSEDMMMTPSNSLLYNFDISKDSALAVDTTRRVKSCNQGAEFCNLQPGVYTLAIFGSSPITFTPSVYIDSMATSHFDHASQAGDLGLIPSNGTVVNSKPDFYTCSTGAEPLDPDTLKNYNEDGVYYDRLKNSVPVPLPKNYNINYKPRRTLWYTFAIPGTGHVKVQLTQLSYNPPRDIFFSVYKSSRNGSIPFSTLKSSGKIDSTTKQGLEFVGMGEYEYRDSIVFVKPGCDTARYYIVVDQDYNNYDITLNYELQANVSYKGTNADYIGDHCDNAVHTSLVGIGTSNASVLMNCHSEGEGFGEDGSNMGCLSDSLPFKTTWFKVSFFATQRSDLTFTINANTSVSSSAIRYRVLYGDCNAMTPGPCINNTYTTFTLNCMPSGDYYVQVAEPAEATGTLELTVTAKAADYPFCKPSNLFQPLANFYTSGGCNGLPVSFQNLSSQGTDITYHWDFGNGHFSTEKSPVEHYKANKQIDTFQVTLTVTDTVHDASDTLTQSVVVYRDPVTINAGKDTSVECGNAVPLNAVCNYPYAIYQWSPAETLDNPFSSTPVANPETDTKYVVEATIGGCIVFDTVFVKVLKDLPVYGSHFLCPGGKLTLSAMPGYQTYIWNTGKYTRSITIDTPGTYTVFSYYDNCKMTDTFTVYPSGKAPHIVHDTIVCSGASARLNAGYPELSHLWSTGDTGQYVTVTKDGSYTVTLSSALCSITDTISVHFEGLEPALGHDTIFCKDFEYLLDAGIADKYVWNTGETTQTVLATKPGSYIVKMKKGSCTAIDSVYVSVYPSLKVNLGADTSVCDTAIMLDAGPGFSYYWLPGGQISRKISAANAGTYSVLVTDKYGCLEGDTIVISNDRCYPTLFVPNSFTPNGDGKNDFFKAEGEYITSFKMEIFNRWGERIFKSDDINKGWDGRFKGEKAQMDVYLWMIEYSGYRTHKLISGNVTLLR